MLLDTLFADQVVVTAIRAAGHNFMIVSKPTDNKYLHEEFSLVTIRRERFELHDGKYLHIYEWASNLPLNSKAQVFLNFVHYEMKKLKMPGEYKTVYQNSWITDYEICEENVQDIVLGGRARWKIESAPQVHKVTMKGCIVKCCKAVGKMMGGPSKSAIRSRFQTTLSGFY